MKKKIVIIGAGSLTFSSRMTADILSYPELSDSHFALVDVEQERLAYAEKIARRIFTEGGYPKATVEATLDRRQALKDADFVIISILVGGYEAIEREIDIPKKYGVDQAIGDTLTPGGIMRALRTIPPMVEMGRDIMDLCPRATVMNYTNPMAMLCWGIKRACPDLRLVGLCHSVQGTVDEWARRLGIELKSVNYTCAGINHSAWITRYEQNGVDLLPRMRAMAVEPKVWKGDTSRMEYLKHLGYPVTECSGHCSEYSPWFRKNDTTIHQYCPGGSWNGGHGFIKQMYDRPDWRETMRAMADWEHPIDLARSMEYGSQIVHAVATGNPVLIHGNVRNDGLIDNLPHGCCVEVPCYVDKNGIQPLKVGSLPMHLAAINRDQIGLQELAVEAALTSDPERVFQAMAMDPLTSAVLTLDQIRAMTAELLEAHRPWLPNFQDRSLEVKPVMVDVDVREVEKHVDPGAGRS